MDDLYGIEDDIEEITNWEPEGAEFPTALDEEDARWIEKRFLAIRYTQAEIAATHEKFDREIAAHLAEIDRLEGRLDGQTGELRKTIRIVAHQLTQYHRAAVAMAEREHAARAAAAVAAGRDVPKMRVPTTIKGVHGDLKSKAAGDPLVRVDEGQEETVAAWLDANCLSDAVRVKPAVAEQRLPDLQKLRKHVARADDGTPLGVMSDDGAVCPHVTIEERDRSFWLVLPDGEKLTVE